MANISHQILKINPAQQLGVPGQGSFDKEEFT
jgi:hypothetical protein